MDNEYDYLRDEALRRSRRGRRELPDSEARFYKAIARLKEMTFRFQADRYFDELVEDLTQWPIALRSVLDAEDEANNMLLRATTLRRMERMMKEMERKQKD